MKFAASPNFQNHWLAGKVPLLRHSLVTPPISLHQHRYTNICFVGVTMAGDDSANGTKTRKRRTREPTRKAPVVRNSEENVVKDLEDFGSDEALQIRASLLKWYDQNKRDLPWRRIIDDDEEGDNRRAYAVWVSEVMLQQTRVITVVDYFNRWMNKWPSLHHLAQASLEEVNEMWAGLGYYKRARFLLEGAKMIVEEGGSFPRAIDNIHKVRGIGDYTAGAIASIAFKEAVPVVDGNVIRVIARLKALSSNPKDSVTTKYIWGLAAQLVDPSRPGDFNQAIMELGATICSPLNPSCSTCPVLGQCRAFSESKHSESVKVTDYPMKVVKAKPRHESAAICVVEILRDQEISEGTPPENGIFLLVKRPEKGLLAGLWEFPSVLVDGAVDLTTRREAIDQFLKESFTLDPRKTCSIVFREDVGELVHIFTHIRLKMYVELLVLNLKGGVDALSKNQDKGSMVWKCVDGKVLSRMGLTSGVKKVYAMIQKFKEIRFPLDSNQAKRKKTKIPRKLRCS